MTSILYILLAILVLSLLIVLHELGHYLVGKWLGFGIVEFAVGMGPVLFRKKGRETDFALRAFLIGGSCKFYGEDESLEEDEQDTPEKKKETVRRFPPEKQFNAQKPWKRFLVLVAGPMMNVLTALVLAFVILLAFGAQATTGTDQFVVVTEVDAGSAAEAAGIREGDILLSINDTSFDDYDSFSELFAAVREKDASVTVLRDATFVVDEDTQGDTTHYTIRTDGGELLTLHAEDIRDKHTGNNRLGVMLSLITKSRSETRYNVFTAAVGAFPFCWDMIRSIYGALFDLVTGKACIDEMSGVIGTVSVMSETMETASAYGIEEFFYVLLYLGALISANFAVVNLLPIPALDGGRIVFVLVEMVRGKPIPPEKEGLVHFIGMILLLLLIAVLMVSDLMNCFRG